MSSAHPRSAGQQVAPQQWDPSGQQLPPQHTVSAAQQVSSQHWLVADGPQQVPPQHWASEASQHEKLSQHRCAEGQQESPQHFWPAGQQVSPQQLEVLGQQVLPQHWAAAASQHVSPQTSGVSQQLSPAHCRAGGSHGVSPHWVTRAVQTPSKQLAEQQSLSWVHAVPFTWAHVAPSAQHTVPLGQLVDVQTHCPWVLQTVPAAQHCVPQHCRGAGQLVGEQTHVPWAVQPVPGGQATHSSPPMPHCWALSGVPAITHAPGSGGRAVQQPLAQRRGTQAHTPPTGGCGPICTHACVLAHAWHGAPPMPQKSSSVPGRQKPSRQQPPQSAVQSTARPQLFVTTPHLRAQVVASLAQPQTPAVPPPPQTCPCRVQF
jgi:hypothetical protein